MSRPMNRNRLPARHFIDGLMSLGALPGRVWGAVLVAALLGGCGGGSDGSENPEAGNGTGLVATAIRQTAPVSACPNGGVSVDAGIDKNTNGVLDASEVTNTQHVCGNNVMVATTPEPAGANCPNGGSKVSAGLDSNGNSVLDEAEILTSNYVCNGANGNNGLGALLTTATEPAGANCPNGGSKIGAGVDANRNGTLEPGEMSSTTYVCNSSTGLPPLLTIITEPVGANCPNGGSKINSGLDTNSNSVLDTAEVTSTAYVCNSSVTPGWTSVSTGPVQTLPNQGYTALAVTTPLVLTLPANPAVNDTLHIVGAGAAGWQLAQNAGQSIVTSSLGGRAVSLASVGANWNERPVSGGLAVASSADGLRLIAGSNSGARVSISSDGGATWTFLSGTPLAIWTAVASSTDGLQLVAANNDEDVSGVIGRLYTSSDGGVTWVARGPTVNWGAVASSADGRRLLAADSGQGSAGGLLYTSDDGGVTWTARDTARQWVSLASSADGMRLLAADSGPGGAGGLLYTSSDGGVTWVARASSRAWVGVASSADGNRLVAATQFHGVGRGIFVSTDSGTTWTRTPALNRRYKALASSADGSRHVATAGSVLWTSAAQAYAPATTTGTGGALSGGQYSAVDMQYIGNGQWTILDHQGTLFVQ